MTIHSARLTCAEGLLAPQQPTPDRLGDPSEKPANFDRLARAYRWMEWSSFGPWLWWCRCTFVGRLGDRRRALVLGDGDGRFTARLLRVNPRVAIDAVDTSPSMLKALLQRAGSDSSRVHTHVADARLLHPGSLNPPSSNRESASAYDLVVSHFFLDCLSTHEVDALARAVTPSLAPGAVWVVSDFAVPKGLFGRLIARPLVAALYQSFGLLTGLRVRHLPDHRSALHNAGFTRAEHCVFLRGLLVAELWKRADKNRNESI